jgi:hypothetical protein
MPHLDLNRSHSANQTMSQQQRHQIGRVYEFETKASLQLRGSEQELLTAWMIVCAACTILVFSANPLGPHVLAAHWLN